MAASFQVPNLAQPAAGSMAIASQLDFTAATTINLDLSPEVLDGKLDFIQSVFIDNADNTAACDIFFGGLPVYGTQRIRAQAFSQGWYPVSWPVGMARISAQSQGGVKVNVLFANIAMPYIVYGPASGITVVPPLTNKALNVVAVGAGGNVQLVAGVALQSIRLYRGIFEVDAPTTLKWTDGPGGTVLFTAFLTTGGGVTFAPSGIAWFNTSAGNDLTLNSSAACNLYGGYGVQQS